MSARSTEVSGLALESSSRDSGAGDVLVVHHLVQGRILPAFAAQFRERDADGDLVRPGGELTAPFEGVHAVKDAQERFLGHFLHEELELGFAGGYPARKCIGQAFHDDRAQILQRGFPGGAVRAQVCKPFFVGADGHGCDYKQKPGFSMKPGFRKSCGRGRGVEPPTSCV